ncbi:methyltransferase NSUN5 [Trichuris trichiura]|uniref:Methyltransferase NSUN5 n=1 Tax=Trichuris trichiura TaxID=36087 RepID=A0A077ZBZ4_TRITR|nr:methyltransferase NSUN5 [Trichuris trichiura]
MMAKLCCGVCTHRCQLEKMRRKAYKKTGNEFFADDSELAMVLLYEFCYGKPNRSSHLLRINILKSAELFKKLKAKYACHVQVPKLPTVPKYVRINSLITSAQEVHRYLNSVGWEMLPVPPSRKKAKELLKTMKRYQYCCDFHVEDLLAFPHGSNLFAEGFNKGGYLIIQDKSTCLPVMALELSPGMTVLDACAAPGNKTSYMATLMKNEGHIIAVEINEKRKQVLVDRLLSFGVKCCEVLCSDFLALNPREKKFQDVTHILLDPPCSGSGIVSRLGEITDTEEISEERLLRLANLQAKMLKHACSFPNIQRCVYSTCSIYEQENEMVVDHVAQKLLGRFHLVRVLPEWKHRGHSSYECGDFCIRCSPKRDLTNGFFVAVFERD